VDLIEERARAYEGGQQSLVISGWKSSDDYKKIVKEWKLTQEALRFLTLSVEEIEQKTRKDIGTWLDTINFGFDEYELEGKFYSLHSDIATLKEGLDPRHESK
jgi:hypothetical protein